MNKYSQIVYVIGFWTGKALCKIFGKLSYCGIRTGICSRELSSETSTALRTQVQRHRFNLKTTTTNMEYWFPVSHQLGRNRRTIYTTPVFVLDSKQMM